MKILRRTQFGNPILRATAQNLIDSEIKSKTTQELIQNMRHTLENRKYGVGLAAPQVGKSVAISVIGIKPTPTRPNLTKQELIIINPKITKTYGAKTPMWEGCVSGAEIYGQVPRFEKIELQWQDAQATKHKKVFEGFIAHVIQHEVDHLNGILYMDRVEDPTTYMTYSEYKKMRKAEAKRAKVVS